MGKIGRGYGSEWHLLRYLGYHRAALSQKVLDITGGISIEWLDFNFSKTSKPLFDDKEWLGLDFIDNETLMEKWRTFWPQRGSAQNWDAIAKINYGDHIEWLLVEAKGHLGELESFCGATSPKSIDTISQALTLASDSFGNKSVPIKNWLMNYYQYANRLAVLAFLQKELLLPNGARLLFLYFYGDTRDDGVIAPQTAKEWKPAIKEIHRWLGVDENAELMKRVHHLFLPVNPNQ